MAMSTLDGANITFDNKNAIYSERKFKETTTQVFPKKKTNFCFADIQCMAMVPCIFQKCGRQMKQGTGVRVCPV